MGFQGVEVGTENRPKIDPKRRCQRERVLASILAGFGAVLGSKLSPKMDPNLEKIELGGRLGGQVEPKTIQQSSRVASWASKLALGGLVGP